MQNKLVEKMTKEMEDVGQALKSVKENIEE